MDLFSCLSPYVFCSFASGSSGNSYYVGSQHEGVIVDVGIFANDVKKGLTANDLSPDNIKCIFITHDHIDHVKGLQTLLKKHPIPVYAHPDCLQGLREGKATRDINPSLMHEIEPFQTLEIGTMQVTPFPVMHDGRGAMGYHFDCEGHTLTIATDVGVLDKDVKTYLQKADSLVIESNYDPEMLEKGPYPYILKQRIKGPFGHLSNFESARFVAENYRPEWKNILLCHLSENNNTPELALKCLYQHFRKAHVVPDPNTSILPLPRHKQTGFVYF